MNPKYNKQEIADIEDTAKQEAKQQYAERQEKKYERMADYSLDPENQKRYGQMKNRWKHVRMRTGKMSSQEYAESKRPLADFHAVSQNQIVSLLRTESQEWIDSLSEKEIIELSNRVYNYLKSKLNGQDFIVLKPMPSPIDKIQNRYRWRIILKGNISEEVNSIINECLQKIYEANYKNTRVSVDVNPNNMI